VELGRQGRIIFAWGKRCLPWSDALMEELECSLLAFLGVICTLRAHVRNRG
jgi:hypothetical protein